MKALIINLLLSVTVCALGACATPEVNKRYAKADFGELTPEDAVKYVTVKVSEGAPVAKQTQSKGLFELSDHGQQAYITALSGKEKKSDDFLSKLVLPLDNKEQETHRDLSKLSYRLVFSISSPKQLLNPANRIESIKLSLKLKDSEVIRFSSWDKIVTNYQNVDIGKLTRGQSGSFSISPEITTALGASAKIGSINYQSSSAEEILIRERMVTSGYLTGSEAVLYQKGAAGMDLTGNIVAEIELEAVDVANTLLFKFNNLPKEDKRRKNNKIEIVKILASYPNLLDNIKGQIDYEFVFREVVKGEETFLEGDDEVIFRKGKGKVEGIPIVPKNDFALKTWRIADSKSNDYLHIHFKGNEMATVINFATPDNAKEFLAWLMECTPTPKDILGNEIRIGPDKVIRQTDLERLSVRLL
jgi:hypothetical protein